MSEIFLHRGAGTAYLRPGATEASLDAWNVPAGAISLPREMTDRLIAIRSEHATWAYETGRAGAGRGTFADALRGGSSLSMWWCSLLYERHPKVTPELYDVYRLRALEMVMEERGAGGLVTDGLTPACNAALEAMCKARGWSFAKNNEAAPEKAQSRLRRVYNRTPAPLRAIARFAWWLWSVRRVVGSCRSLPPSSAPTGTITTYFPNIDVRKAEEGVFRSRYWESLHDALQDDAGARNTPAVRWLFVLFPSPQGSLAKCCGFRDNFRKTRKSGVSFNYLEEFLTPGGVLKSLVRYTRIAIMSAVFGKKIRSSFHFADSTLDLWPLLSGEYAESFRGWRCLERCLQQKGIENYVALSGRQRYWTFPLENCPWERMLTHAVHEAGAGTVYGAQHSTIRPTDFRYFDDPRTFSDPGTSAFQPDYVVGNGSAAVSQWADAGVPEARLRKAEALRYLYLAGSEPAPFTGTPGDLLVVTSFFRDETEAHLKLLAEALQAGLLGNFRVTVKPHPYLPVQERLSGLLHGRTEGLRFSTAPIADELACNPLVWASNSTTVALEAAIKGIPVMVMQPSGDFDLCPLQNIKELPRTSNLDDVRAGLASAAPLSLAPDYLLLDTSLTAWRTMLGLRHMGS